MRVIYSLAFMNAQLAMITSGGSKARARKALRRVLINTDPTPPAAS
jgi:hypothetical protein